MRGGRNGWVKLSCFITRWPHDTFASILNIAIEDRMKHVILLCCAINLPLTSITHSSDAPGDAESSMRLCQDYHLNERLIYASNPNKQRLSR